MEAIEKWVGCGCCPTIGGGIVSRTSVQIARKIMATPDDHFIAGPDCRVRISLRGGVVIASDYPTVRIWIVSAARVQVTVAIIAAPNDHLIASPHCGVQFSMRGGVGKADVCPTVSHRIVLSTSV